jgi:hypothetical protein
MKKISFWDIVPCRLVVVDRRFKGVYCLLCQGDLPDNGGSTHLRNVGLLQRDYSAQYPRRLSSPENILVTVLKPRQDHHHVKTTLHYEIRSHTVPREPWTQVA